VLHHDVTAKSAVLRAIRAQPCCKLLRLEKAGGDAHAARLTIFWKYVSQESEARQSAQRVQTSIEEAVAIDKNDRGSDKPPHPVGARAPADRRTQGPSSRAKENDTCSSRKPKGGKPTTNKGKRPGG